MSSHSVHLPPDSVDSQHLALLSEVSRDQHNSPLLILDSDFKWGVSSFDVFDRLHQNNFEDAHLAAFHGFLESMTYLLG